MTVKAAVAAALRSLDPIGELTLPKMTSAC